MIRLTNEQWERIRNHFPEEHIPDGRPGRKPIPTRRVFEAVLWILNTGAQWRMLPQSYSNYKSVHRRFQTWCRDEVLPDFYMIEAKPENLIGDRAYDSDPLDEELRKDGIEMIAPHRSNRSKPPTQDRPLYATLARGALLCLDSMAAPHPRPLGILRPELPRLCTARLPRCPLQAILR